MKALILFLITTVSIAQSINIGTDAKILILGTDNQYTKHSAKFNIEAKIEYIDNNSNYIALGYKYVDLSKPYNAYYIDLGYSFQNNKISIIPSLELGFLMRDKQYNHGCLYPQINTSLRYNLEFIEVGFKGYLQYARDLPDRTFRYGGTIELIKKINL